MFQQSSYAESERGQLVLLFFIGYTYKKCHEKVKLHKIDEPSSRLKKWCEPVQKTTRVYEDRFI